MDLEFAICPICFDPLNNDVHFCSDGFLYDRKCFQNLEFRKPLNREKFFYRLPRKKLLII